MGRHSSLARRWAATAVVVGLVTLGATGTAQADDIADGTPCSEAARACVDLDERIAWLIEDGDVARGPVPISPGGPERETPRGDFRVEWKHRDHRSGEFDGAPMPFAVFFAAGGIAFHEGNLHTPSAGCVRLAFEDAEAFFGHLRVGDRVEVR
ncbi:L,D-transpeptidase [Pseudonocardia sp.]|uniref:L,D-transpeptidase n=1 Tax=Pseudonocardia sp. TaxID=60912 RepID=UPI002602CFB3|nr:L,D-transpeptidase [Pseudonocardia sp.]